MHLISITGIFENTFKNTWKWIHIFLPIGLVVSLVSLFLNSMFFNQALAANATFGDGLASFWQSFGLMMLLGVTMYGLQLSLYAAVLERRGDWMNFGLLRFAKRIVFVFIGVLIYYLIYLLGAMLLLIPGLMAAILLSMMPMLILLDGSNPFRAVQESFDLVWGNAWMFLGVNLIFIVAIVAISLVPGFFIGFGETVGMASGSIAPDFGAWQTYLYLVLNGVVISLYSVFFLETFYDLKRVREEKRKLVEEDGRE
ncbi:MAG: hypothetical protein R3217_03095 [Gammaproteobacteria bacterium]|nr:hypothetical protein [Gammaproteobacteria bacterium]